MVVLRVHVQGARGGRRGVNAVDQSHRQSVTREVRRVDGEDTSGDCITDRLMSVVGVEVWRCNDLGLSRFGRR